MSNQYVYTNNNQLKSKKDKINIDPPLENQVQTVHQLFNNLIKIINDNIQTNEDENEDFFNQQKGEVKKNKNINVKSIGIELKSDIHKLYVDTVKTLRYAQKHDQGDNIQNCKLYLIELFKDLRSNLHNLRIEMITLLQDTINLKGNKLSNSLLFDYEDLIDEIMSQFCEDLYDIYLKMLQYSDTDFSSSIFTSLFDGIYDFTEDLEKFYLELIQGVNSIAYPSNSTANFVNNCPEFNVDQSDKSESLIYTQRVKKITKFFTDQMKQFLIDFNESAKYVHKMHKRIHDFSLNFYEQIMKSNPKFNLFDFETIYKPRFNGFADVCNYYRFIKQKKAKTTTTATSDDESSDAESSTPPNIHDLDFEDIWFKVREDSCINFTEEQLQSSGDTLQSDLTKVWHASRTRADSLAAGGLLYAAMNARFDAHAPGLALADAASAYNFAVKSGTEECGDDDDLPSSLQSLLAGMIDAASSSLLALRHAQVRHLSNPPSGGGGGDYVRKARNLTEEIQSRTLDLNAALCLGREADFIISQRAIGDCRPSLAHADGVEEEEEDYVDDYADSFQTYDNEESDEIKKQLDKIISIGNSVFAHARASSNADFNDRPRVEKQAQAKILTKSLKMSIQRGMSEEALTQVNCAEDAMVSTYLQLFASTHGILVALIRTSNYEEALEVKLELNERVPELMGHLDSIRKRAKARDDVATIKAIDERASYIRGMQEGDIRGCICESLRNVIDATIANYDRNMKIISDECADKVSRMRVALDENVQAVKNDKHIPDLILIEKKKIIARRKEEKRPDTHDYEDEESAIGGYIERKKYQLAEREKARLAKKKEDARKRKIDDVEGRYEAMKEQKLEEQKNELQGMERRFLKKKEHEERKSMQLKAEQTKLLVTSMKTSSIRHYQFALKILKVDQKAKRDVQKMLNKVVNESIGQKQETVKELADLLDKQGNKTDWIQ